MTSREGRVATDPGRHRSSREGGEFYAPRFVNSGAAVRRPILRRVGLTKAIETLWTVSEARDRPRDEHVTGRPELPVLALPSNSTIDCTAALRQALRTLVARHGLHGASMSAIAKEAGVAQGTAYVHYESKEQLLVAAYLELKREMGTSGVRRSRSRSIAA